MNTFIQRVVTELLSNPQELIHTTLVLPGKRPMLFFRQEFQKQSSGIILPKMISIEDFIADLAQVQIISDITLWFETFKAYQKCFQTPESFDDFIKWAPTVLKDFDDIDSTLLNPDPFFDYLVSIERIKNWGVEEDIQDKNALIKNHFEFWKMIKLLYAQLKQDLSEKGLAYNGLANRLAVENLEQLFSDQQHYVFAGFNALTVAEEKIIFGLEREAKAKLFWDVDRYFLNPIQESGTFLRRHKSRSNDWNWTFDDFEKTKNIKVTGISKQVGQAKFVAEILQHKTEEEIKKTALILADEAILPAILNALPENIKHINISMGIPLKSIPLAQFFKSVFELQMNREKLGKGKVFYFKNIIQILENSSLKSFQTSVDLQTIHDIKTLNRIFTTAGFLQQNLEGSYFQSLFKIPVNPKDFIQTLLDFTQKLLQNELSENALMREYLFYFEKVFTQLYNEIKVLDQVSNYKTLHLLYQKIVQSETLSFIGEPLEGLQIMGVLETRLINFDHIIMTSVNEEVLPLGRQNNTFIPYDIRKEKGLNTFTDNDAIYAYHFYRLLSRAVNIDLIYNTDPDGMGAGDKSRFIEQMRFESPHKLNFTFAKPYFEIVPKSQLIIEKTSETQKILKKWVEETGISPSRLGTYLRNPIEFYEQIVLNVNDIEEAEETISAKTLGNIVHGTLEELYEPLLNRVLHQNDFKGINQIKDEVLLKYFKKEYKEGDIDKGQNLLVHHVAKRIVDGVLTRDESTAKNDELIILELEKKYELDFQLDDYQIKLKGYIDRIDSVNGLKRIIDYKTGYATDIKIKSEKLDEVFADAKHAKALQLIFYAHLFLRQEGNQNEKIQLCIYPIKFPKRDLFKLNIDNEDVIEYSTVENTQEFLENLIREILNSDLPFEEKLD